jgi:hypothetical protein
VHHGIAFLACQGIVYLPLSIINVDYLTLLLCILERRLSAELNSFATLTGIPTFFAKAGLWAAAAIVLRCLGDLEGISSLSLA